MMCLVWPELALSAQMCGVWQPRTGHAVQKGLTISAITTNFRRLTKKHIYRVNRRDLRLLLLLLIADNVCGGSDVNSLLINH